MPGIPEPLADAKKQNLKMVIASASKNVPKILTRLGIMDKFDGIVDPAALHHGSQILKSMKKLKPLRASRLMK